MTSKPLQSSKMSLFDAKNSVANRDIHDEEKHAFDERNEDAKEQIEALLRSLDILARLATMDTADYQASLQHGSASSISNHNEAAGRNMCQLQKSLENIQRRWKLEDTPILQLTTAIHRFHSTINNLQQDAEEHTVLYNNLAQKLQQNQKRNAKLERALAKVCAKNEKLAAKVKRGTQEKQSMVKQVKGYVKQIKDAKTEHKEMEEQMVAYQLYSHQHFLQQQPSQPPRGRSVSVDYPTRKTSSPKASFAKGKFAARRRVMSQDAKKTSEIDAPDFDLDGKRIILQGMENFCVEDAFHDQDHSCGGDDNSVFSRTSSVTSSVSSLVTDEGVATIRFSPLRWSPGGRTPTRLRTHSNDGGTENKHSFWGSTACWPSSTKPNKSPPMVTLTFPSASVIGLQFDKVEFKAGLQEPSLSNQPKGLLTLLEPEDEEKLAIHNKHDNAQGQTNKKSSKFHLKWNNVFGKGSGGSSDALTLSTGKAASSNDTSRNEAFVVSGFVGFNDELNERPNLGARLVAISGEPVDPNWSLSELQDQIGNAESSDRQPLLSRTEAITSQAKLRDNTVVTLTLRDDHLDKAPTSLSDKDSKDQHIIPQGTSGHSKPRISSNDELLGVSLDASGSAKLASSFNIFKKAPTRGGLTTSEPSASKESQKTATFETLDEGMTSTMSKISYLFSLKSNEAQDLGDSSQQEQVTTARKDHDEKNKAESPNLRLDLSRTATVPNNPSFLAPKSDDFQNTVATGQKPTAIKTQEPGIQKSELNLDPSHPATLGDETNSFLPSASALTNQDQDARGRQTIDYSAADSSIGQSVTTRDVNVSEPDVLSDLKSSGDEEQREEKNSGAESKHEPEMNAKKAKMADSQRSSEDPEEEAESATVQDKILLKSTDEEEQQSSAGERLRRSMLTMGKMFSNPFSHPEEVNSDDTML